MIQNKYKFRTEEIQLSLPKNGTRFYEIESSYILNYTKNIRCTHSKDFSVSIHSDEDQPYVRLIDIQLHNSNFLFSDGSFAIQDIIRKTSSLYSKLLLSVSYQGEILDVLNIDIIQEKWQGLKQYFKLKYRGNQVQRFISKIDQIIDSKEELSKEILLYRNFGGLLKPMFQKYNSDACAYIEQPLSTKYGKINVTEKMLLESVRDNGDIQLQSVVKYPENREYVSLNGTYNFSGLQESWLLQGVISCHERYGRQKYLSTTKIIQL